MVPVILLILILLTPSWADATIRYVSTSGSDAAAGTEDAPKRTIAHCVGLMVAGDICYVRGGTYVETATIRFGTSGTQAAPIQLLNYPGEKPIIDWPANTSTYRILVQHLSGTNVAIGWITISGFEVRDGFEGMKFTSMHNSTISNNWFHDNNNQGILGIGGHHNTFTRNIVNHNGNFPNCDTNGICNQAHGIYVHGDTYTITHNLIYDNVGYGIQMNGSSTSAFDSTKHPSSAFAGASNWIVAENTLAYNYGRAGITVWGNLCNNLRLENNIFYENAQNSSSEPQGVKFTSTACTGIQIRNNHFYATAPGGTTGIGSGATEGVHYTQSGNVTNVSAPAFVNAGSTVPVSPDFTLTASAPVNIARVNEFSNNSTLVNGPHKTSANPTATITTNKITLTFPLSTATPVQNISATGVTIGCTGSSCPGSPTVGTVSRIVGTDTQVEVIINGISGDACVSTNQDWTVSYASASGSWTTNDNIGPYPGLNQKIFSFTNLAVTNQCTGSGPTSYPAGYHLHYKFDEGTGTSANDESANNLDGTLTNGPTWGAGKTGSGVVLTGNNTEHVAIPYGNGINPSTQSLTIAFGVNIPAGNESLSRAYFGAPLGTSQRLYVSTASGTWRIGIQGSSDSTAGDIAVTSGWHNVCLTMNSGTDIATLYIDGIASTAAGAVKSYTSYTLAGDFDLGRIADIATGGGGGTYDDLLIYTSVADCAAISSAFNAPPPAAAGTLAQAAIQYQGVILDTAGNPIVVGPSVQSIEVPADGGVVILFQVHCQNISDCAITAFKLVYSKNGSLTFQQVPDIETADGVWMWGGTTESNLNNGARTTRLTGSCAVTNGTTQVTAAQVPSVDLPQDGCTVLAYIIRVGATHTGDYYDFKLRTEADLDFTGGYTQTARVRVVNPMASGVGF